MIGQRQPGEQHAFGRAHQVDQIFPAPVPAFVVFVVIDQRVGDQTQHLVKDHQGEQVGRERPAHGGGERGGETGEKPGLGVLVQVPHVANGIDRRDDPQERGGSREHHSQRVDPECKVDPWQDLEQLQFERSARQNPGRHRDDDAEHDHRRRRRDRVPELVAIT